MRPKALPVKHCGAFMFMFLVVVAAVLTAGLALTVLPLLVGLIAAVVTDRRRK